jgi:hypothetical protein
MILLAAVVLPAPGAPIKMSNVRVCEAMVADSQTAFCYRHGCESATNIPAMRRPRRAAAGRGILLLISCSHSILFCCYSG